MTDLEKLTALKNMVGSKDADEVLSTYLSLAGKKIIAKAYPYKHDVTAVPGQYESLQLEIAAYMLNKRGAEYQTTHSENGISRSWGSADVPSEMMSSITPFCGAIT